MLGYERFVVSLRTSEDVNIIRRPDVAEDNGGVPLQPRQPRPLHRRLPERRAERRLIQCQDVRRERHRVLARNELPRGKRRPRRQLLRELHVPRTHTLGDVSV